MDRGARGEAARQRLAGDEALIHPGDAGEHDAVDRHALARPHQHDVARLHRRRRHGDDGAVRLDAVGERGLQRGEVAGFRAGAPAHGMFEIAAGEQEEAAA